MLQRIILVAILVCAWPLAIAGAGAFELVEIAPGVFAHQGQTALMTRENKGEIANLGAIVGADGVVVVDTGGSLAEGKEFLAALQQKTAKPIRFVVNTHAHPDHLFGNGAFAETGTVFVGHKNLPRALAERGRFYLSSFREALGPLIDEVTIVAPTLTVDGVMRLDVGGREIVLQTWRTAHSDADLTVLDTQTKTLFAGDLLFMRHVPVVDGSLLGFLEVVGELEKIDAVRVVPGHGPAVAPWPQALAAQRDYLQRLTRDLRAQIAGGTGLAAASAAAGQSERSKWELFDDYNIRNATAGFAELEWESP